MIIWLVLKSIFETILQEKSNLQLCLTTIAKLRFCETKTPGNLTTNKEK